MRRIRKRLDRTAIVGLRRAEASLAALSTNSLRILSLRMFGQGPVFGELVEGDLTAASGQSLNENKNGIKEVGVVQWLGF